MFLHLSVSHSVHRGAGAYATHAPLPCTHPATHTCPPTTHAPRHTCPLPCMPPVTHAPYHAHPHHAQPPAAHAPLPCMPPCHAHPPATYAPCHACSPLPCTHPCHTRPPPSATRWHLQRAVPILLECILVINTFTLQEILPGEFLHERAVDRHTQLRHGDPGCARRLSHRYRLVHHGARRHCCRHFRSREYLLLRHFRFHEYQLFTSLPFREFY